MRHFGLAAAFVATAATFQFAASDRTGAGEAGTGRAPIAEVEAAASLFPRYKKKEMSAWTEYKLPPDCSPVDEGSWSVSVKPKYGRYTTGTVTGHLGNGDCPDHTYKFAAIYYEWIEHNNKSNTDTFTGTWKSKDFSQTQTFDMTVKIVRPAGETTAFTGWQETRGLWQQTLKPPSDDPDFDFSGETVKETNVGTSDTCYDGKFPFGQATLTPHQWEVHDKVRWGPDGVGWGANVGSGGGCAIEYYRCVKRTPCGFTLQQQMQISSPADKGTFHDYGAVNTLTSNIEGTTLWGGKQGVGDITSQRAGGAQQKQFWLTGPLNCPKVVSLSAC